MNSKSLVIAAASAAAIAMSGCNTVPTYPLDAGGKTYVDCRMTKDCQVKLSHSWWHTGYPDEIWVNVASNEKVYITWTIEGNDGTTFSEGDGIFLKDPALKALFDCKQDPNKKHVYVCSNSRDLRPGGTYVYGIKTKGFFSGPDIDPVIKNGA